MNKEYDYLIVGAGLCGAVFAHEAKKAGKTCLVIDRRNHVAGNIYTYELHGITVHKFGAHIFHTNNEHVWEYVNRFVSFNQFVNSPLANYNGKLYNLPFNMNTFYQLWGTVSPAEAQFRMEQQRRASHIENPRNLEEQAINLVGSDVYKILIKEYTQKQWGRPCHELPAFIIRRLPVRFNYNNNYYDARFQGIPQKGYTALIEMLLQNSDVRLNTDYISEKNFLKKIASKIIYTGCIDEYFEYCYGPLEYRSVNFETEVLDISNYQGNAVVNYTDLKTPYTRIIEHKHFLFGKQPQTVISREYPEEWKLGTEPYYPINNDKNEALYKRYGALAKKEKNVIFCGRLGGYRYYDMDTTIENALVIARKEGFCSI